jgi:hypothetical protein
MRSRVRQRRHLGIILHDLSIEAKALVPKAAAAAITRKGVQIPWEFTPRQRAIFLLHIAAELEHVLMVEYLYAGFSIGGEQVPLERQAEVAQWREVILGIAKEEMGHLMTVQNLLRCLGGPLNLDREDYPWDSEFYPFPFKLEPLTRESLAKYVVAESPAPHLWTGAEADEIRTLAKEGVDSSPLHRVGELYDAIQALLEDPDALKDGDFRGSTYPFQANWDEWGRGYQAGARGNAMGGAVPGTPDVILLPVTARTDSLAALKAVATQGEANPTADDGAPSHFARFLQIFRQMPTDNSWSPSRNVPKNPIVVPDSLEEGEAGAWQGTPITHPETKLWAHLFNVRYRLLLTCLLHTFYYPSNLSEISQTTPRGLLVHGAFGEMYNLRALSEIIVQMPLAADNAKRMAGPPFQMPYTLKLALDPADRWREHMDLLQASASLIECLLLEHNPRGHRTYLLALRKVDCETIKVIEAILGDHPISI